MYRQAEPFDDEDDDWCSESEHEESHDEDDYYDEFGGDSGGETNKDGSLKPLFCPDHGGYWPHARTPPDGRAITLSRSLSNYSGRVKSFHDDIDTVINTVDLRLRFIPQHIRTQATFNEESLRMIFYGVHQTLYLWQYIDSDCRLEEHHFDDERGNKFVDVVMTSSVGYGYYKALIELKYANEHHFDGNEALDAMSSDELLDALDAMSSDELLDVSYTFVGSNKTTMRSKEAADWEKLKRITDGKPGYLGITLCGVGGRLLRGTPTGCWATRGECHQETFKPSSVNSLKSFVKEGLVFLFNRLPRRVIEAKTFNSESLRMLVFGFSSFHARGFGFDDDACKLVLAVVGTDQSTCMSGSLTIAFEFFRGSDPSLRVQWSEALYKYQNEIGGAPQLAAFGWLNEDTGNYDVDVFDLR